MRPHPRQIGVRMQPRRRNNFSPLLSKGIHPKFTHIDLQASNPKCESIFEPFSTPFVQHPAEVKVVMLCRRVVVPQLPFYAFILAVRHSD
ncbi:hypothetical protein J6590_028392 [Homalodisca vitripennis]|nr:hypothetical protein J6590_028392 [Homalodisca vitripennis]